MDHSFVYVITLDGELMAHWGAFLSEEEAKTMAAAEAEAMRAIGRVLVYQLALNRAWGNWLLPVITAEGPVEYPGGGLPPLPSDE
jgi:hypothetical protein